MNIETHEQYDDEIGIKTLGESCEFKNGKNITKDNFVEGEYPVVGGGQKPMGFHNQYNTNENTILCSSSGAYSGFISKYITKVWASDCFSIIPKDHLIDNQYLYYLLKMFLQDKIYKLQSGSAQPHVYSKDLQNIQIPIPSLARQKEIVEYLDFIYEKTIKTSQTKIAELKMLNEYCLKNQEKCGKNVVKTLGEVCDMSIKGNTNTHEISNTGEYPFYKASVSNPSGTHNSYCFDDDEYILFIKSGGNSLKPLSLSHGIGKVYLVNCKSSGNTEVVKIKNNQHVILKYLYYYLQNEQLNIQKLAKYSTNLGHINMNEFKSIQIPIPSLARQKEIVDYCDHNESLIKQLENEIELNKTQARQFLKGIVKTQEQDDLIQVDEVIDDEEQEVEDEEDDEYAYEKLIEEYNKNDEEQELM
jgi:restriction endonuclease S subunit